MTGRIIETRREAKGCVDEMIENQSQEEAAEKIRRVRHEINNALTALFGNAQMLLLRGNLDEKSRQRVARIEEQAHRIKELVAGLKEE